MTKQLLKGTGGKQVSLYLLNIFMIIIYPLLLTLMIRTIILFFFFKFSSWILKPINSLIAVACNQSHHPTSSFVSLFKLAWAGRSSARHITLALFYNNTVLVLKIVLFMSSVSIPLSNRIYISRYTTNLTKVSSLLPLQHSI